MENEYILGRNYIYGENGAEKDARRGYEYYLEGYKKGDMKCAYGLGICYDNGHHVEKDKETALKYFDEAFKQLYSEAKHGDKYCQFMIACYYEFGDMGQKKDASKAAEWYERSAKQGYAPAQRNFGRICHAGKNFTKAVEWFAKAAEQGDANAQSSLGICYASGKGVTQSDAKAVEWFTKAAERGFAEAQYYLAVSYRDGRALQKSEEKAVEWFIKAAGQGYAKAQYNLGVCYNEGIVVQENCGKAMEWLNKAAAQGNEQAIEMLKKFKKNKYGTWEYAAN